MSEDLDEAVQRGVIEDFADVIVGGTPSTANAAFWNGDVVWVTPTDITGASGPVLCASARSITEAGVAASSARIVPAGSVLVTTRATVGPCVLSGRPVATNQGVTALVPNEHLDARWLYYWVLANRREFVSRGSGNTFPEVSRSKTRAIPIAVPSLSVQRRIADLFTAHDAVAECARASVAAATNLFWSLLNARLGSLDAVATKLDSILVGIVGGKSPRCDDRPPRAGEWGVLKLSAINPLGFRASEAKTLPASVEPFESARIRRGDVVITRSNTPERVGLVAHVDEDPGALLLSDLTWKLDVDERVEPRYLAYALSARAARSAITAVASGTSASMKKLNHAKVRALVIPLPTSRKLQADIADEFDEARWNISCLQVELDQLDQLRSSLLEAVFSGVCKMPPEYDELLGAAAVG